MQTSLKNNRRYDIDFWRVATILAVYLHHICMPFNGDTFHIMNSTSSALLNHLMVFFEQLRLPLLFLISGVGTVYAFGKRNWWQFIIERTKRLYVPLLFGVLFIVPLQVYYENITSYTSIWSAYPKIVLQFKVNHLWFIEHLLIISIISIPLILLLKSKWFSIYIQKLHRFFDSPLGIFSLVIPLSIIYLISKSYYPEDSKSISNLSVALFFLYFYIVGIVFTLCNGFWDIIKKYRHFNGYISMVVFIIFYTYYFIPREWISPYLSIETRWQIWYLCCCLVSWSFIITLLGYGQVWFNQTSAILNKANEAIYPFYILHQTIIIAVGFYIIQTSFSIFIKILLMILISFPICIILYRYLIYPFSWIRFLFGMKKK